MLSNLSLIHRLKARKPFFIVAEFSLNKAMHVKNWGKIAPETRTVLFDKLFAGNCVVAVHNEVGVWRGVKRMNEADRCNADHWILFKDMSWKNFIIFQLRNSVKTADQNSVRRRLYLLKDRGLSYLRIKRKSGQDKVFFVFLCTRKKCQDVYIQSEFGSNISVLVGIFVLLFSSRKLFLNSRHSCKWTVA